tara:strand:+ start:370 stop:1227 length:858 start_codon:yes stop_codon:yes gene_type:complete
MNILITGANGYLAKKFVKELASVNKHHLFLLVRKNTNVEYLVKYVNKENLIFYDDTIESLNKMKKKKINLVFHLANYYPDSKRPAMPEKIISSNLTLIINVITILGNKSNFKIINISSNAADNDSTLYGNVKLTTEKFLAENYNCSTYRLHDTYGEQDPRPKLINKLITHSRDGKAFKMKSPPNKQIHLIYVKDVISAFLSIVENHEDYEEYDSTKSSIINHIYSDTMTLKEVIETFNSVSNKKVNVTWLKNNDLLQDLKSPGNFPINWKPKYDLATGLREILNL